MLGLGKIPRVILSTLRCTLERDPVWGRLLVKLKIPGRGFAALLFAVHPLCCQLGPGRLAENQDTLPAVRSSQSCGCTSLDSLPYEIQAKARQVTDGCGATAPPVDALALIAACSPDSAKTSHRRAPLVFARPVLALQQNRINPSGFFCQPLLIFLFHWPFGLIRLWFQNTNPCRRDICDRRLLGTLGGVGQNFGSISERRSCHRTEAWFNLRRAIDPTALTALACRCAV